MDPSPSTGSDDEIGHYVQRIAVGQGASDVVSEPRRTYGQPAVADRDDATRAYSDKRFQRGMRLGGRRLLLPFDLQGDVDELVLLAADELALAGPVQQLVGGHAVALGLADGVLEEA